MIYYKFICHYARLLHLFFIFRHAFSEMKKMSVILLRFLTDVQLELKQESRFAVISPFLILKSHRIFYT